MDNKGNLKTIEEKLLKGNGKEKVMLNLVNTMKKKVKISKEHQSFEENQRQTIDQKESCR